MSSFTNQSIPVTDDALADLPGWMLQQGRAHKLDWLLAHADDGVIWGRIDAAGLHTSSESSPDVSPLLRAVTLQQGRLFGEGGELLLWQSGDGWKARLLADGVLGDDYFDEDQIVWGDSAEPAPDGFTRLREGVQGNVHVVPLRVDSSAAERRRIRLCVRHYLDYNEDGEARIAASRLLALVVKS